MIFIEILICVIITNKQPVHLKCVVNVIPIGVENVECFFLLSGNKFELLLKTLNSYTTYKICTHMQNFIPVDSYLTIPPVQSHFFIPLNVNNIQVLPLRENYT